MGNKPVLTSSLIVAAVAAVIAILNAYGISVGDARAKAIEDAIPILWVLGFALYYAVKQGVTPNTEVAALQDAARQNGREYERKLMQLHAAGAVLATSDEATANAVAAIKRYCPPTTITAPAAPVAPTGPVGPVGPAAAVVS